MRDFGRLLLIVRKVFGGGKPRSTEQAENKGHEPSINSLAVTHSSLTEVGIAVLLSCTVVS